MIHTGFLTCVTLGSVLCPPILAPAMLFPQVDPQTTWQAPLMMPWDKIRSTETSITVTWTPAWNPWSEVSSYYLEARRPSPLGGAFSIANLERLQFRESEIPEGPGEAAWGPWMKVYQGLGRAYTLGVRYGTGHAAQFRVAACGPDARVQGCSNYSNVLTAHTTMSAMVDKVNIYVRGTGKNAMNYTIIKVNNITVYQRRDETGLVLAVFSRLDLSLRWLKTYNTHASRAESIQMSKDIRQFNASFFIIVASTIAFEWHASRTLARTMEFCGAYHFGQWSYIFAEQGHYESNVSDIQDTASQDEFGHPYAFIGIPGIGTGMGWESLMLNTGHYLPIPSLSVPTAIVIAIAYYDYVARQYRLESIAATKADFYKEGRSPYPETLHNPYPAGKRPSPNDYNTTLIPNMSDYKPYVGTLANHIQKLIEINSTVPPYNYAFAIRSISGQIFRDPRPLLWWKTELETVWGGPSQRYSPDGTLMQAGLPLAARPCADFVYSGYLWASPELCGINGSECCPFIDGPNFTAGRCGIGVAPTVCTNNVVVVLNESFTVISAPYVTPWTLYPAPNNSTNNTTATSSTTTTRLPSR